MKRIFVLMSLLLIFVSCSDGTFVDSSEFIEYFVSSFEGEDGSKTVLNTDANYCVEWLSGDPVAVYDGTSVHLFEATPIERDKKKAILYPDKESLKVPAGRTYHALYPYDSEARWEGSKVTFTIPSENDAVSGTFQYNASVGSTTTSVIHFKNIGALISFRVNRSNICKVVFENLDGGALSGEVTVDCKNPDECIVTEGKGSNTVTLNGVLKSNSYYYVTVLPGEYTKGIKVTCYNSSEETISQITSPFTLSRSHRIAMGYVTKENGGEGDSLPFIPYGAVYDNTVPGGYYYSLNCGIDVAGANVAVDESKCWNDYCDPEQVLAANPSANEVAPVNPCVEGWALPTEAQIHQLLTEGVTTLDENEGLFWNLSDGITSVNTGVLWGTTNFNAMSCETRKGSNSSVWRLQVQVSKDKTTGKYYKAAFKCSSHARTETFSAKNAILRCIRVSETTR